MLKLFINKNFKAILLTSLLFLIYYRSPYIFLNGRFIAEEGSFWFRNAFLFGPIEGLTQVFIGSAYFNLWANLSSVVASVLPLEYAPLGTVYMALIVQLYLYNFIIFSESNFFVNKTDRILLSLIVLIAPPMVASVWLNTLVSQVYFTIITILIFFQKDITNSFFNKSSPIIIFFSGFSSVLPCVLSPFFVLKYLKDKSRFNLMNLIAISVPTIFQLIIFLYAKITGLEKLLADGPRYILSFTKIVSYFYNVIVKSFLGRDLTQFIFDKLFNEKSFLLVIVLITILILFFLKISFTKIKQDKIILYLILFFILQSFLVIYVAKFEGVQGRYAVVPGILLIFICYRLFQISSGFLRIITFSLILLSLTSGIYEYKFNNIYPELLSCIDCPEWKSEVTKWKNDNTYILKIWAYPQRSMDLKY
jgi:hypothetical protein